MFEFRLRIVEAGPASYLGIVEGFPQVMVHATSPGQAEGDLVRALIDHLERMQDQGSTMIQLDDLPTVRELRLHLCSEQG
jgi:hypothetical protein